MTSSDSAPSMRAFRYVTTPSVAVSPASAPLTGMIECAVMPGAMGVAARASRNGLPGRIE